MPNQMECRLSLICLGDIEHPKFSIWTSKKKGTTNQHDLFHPCSENVPTKHPKGIRVSVGKEDKLKAQKNEFKASRMLYGTMV